MSAPVVLTPHQCDAVSAALDALQDDAQVFAIRGLAGTGKTTLIPHLRDLIRTTLHATTSVSSPTHRAARILKKKGIDDAATVHSLALTPYFKGDYAWACRWLGEDCPAREGAIEDRTPDVNGVPYLLHGACERKGVKPKTLLGHVRRHGAKKALASIGVNGKHYFDDFGPKKMEGVLIVDEASMVGKKMLDLCLEAFPQVILIGDPGQLQPVKDIAQLAHVPGFLLEHIHRQAADSAIIQLAYAARNGQVNWRNFGSTSDSDVRQIREAEATRFLRSPLLVWRNGVREQCTHAIRTQLGYDRDAPHVGEPLMCRATSPRDRAEGFFNQGLWRVVETSKHDARRVTIQEEDTDFTADVLLHLEELDGDDIDPDSVPFRFAYAMTTHTAQGGEWDEVFVSKKELMAFESTSKKRQDDEYKCYSYTAITRAKTTLNLLTEHLFLSASKGLTVPVTMELPNEAPVNDATLVTSRAPGVPDPDALNDIPEPVLPSELVTAITPETPVNDSPIVETQHLNGAVSRIPEAMLPLAHGFCDYLQHRLHEWMMNEHRELTKGMDVTMSGIRDYALKVLQGNEHSQYSMADAMKTWSENGLPLVSPPYQVVLRLRSPQGVGMTLTITKATSAQLVEALQGVSAWLHSAGYVPDDSTAFAA